MGILFKPVRNKYEARGEARGRAEGRSKARAEFRSAASEWYARLERARREGRKFSEPPPWESPNGKGE